MLLPVTTATASLLGILFALLSIAVSGQRNRTRIGLGGGDASAPLGKEDTASPLLVAIRRHGSFAEFVPISLLLLMLLELAATAQNTLMGLAGALVLSRLMVIAGLGRAAPNVLRAGGNLLQLLMIVTSCILGLTIVFVH